MQVQSLVFASVRLVSFNEVVKYILHIGSEFIVGRCISGDHATNCGCRVLLLTICKTGNE